MNKKKNIKPNQPNGWIMIQWPLFSSKLYNDNNKKKLDRWRLENENKNRWVLWVALIPNLSFELDNILVFLILMGSFIKKIFFIDLKRYIFFFYIFDVERKVLL